MLWHVYVTDSERMIGYRPAHHDDGNVEGKETFDGVFE